ncbi:BglG family transcription antiterminator [Clostridium septicum]|uniref:BglG family transcription antiterminator n=1 Tax=Clostridium septicum TaxID=1504 RepID=A0A9N7PKH3_CLOSE|nr:BglG family transcription antiterminator [Clostridium septicum]AYE34017.1 hypothetical protein CP523_05820 [Clostridium septicum]MDU1314550.1 BglG family transcription antiterminator [Clostridium septicum]QAS59389.1 BglG family transcription antiterminator [Clostridium septicum]UEC21358.1 BglG family transcription antiterminator [Clostridium septicum]USS00597.1 BglG family transcription antiterminator [Clostridium septicum]
MINNLRLEKILKILLDSNKVVTGDQLCNTVGVSSRTIRSDVKELNNILESEGAVILSEKGKGYILNILIEDKFKSFLKKIQDENSYINLTAEGRAEYIIMKLLLNDLKGIEGITQIDLADELFISLSSLKNDIKLAKTNLDLFSLDIEKCGNKGIKISGNEESIRDCINRNLASNNKFLRKNFEKILKKSFKEKSFIVREILKDNIEKFNLRLTDIAFTHLLTYLSIMLVRNDIGKNVSYERKEIDNLNKEPKIAIAKSIENSIKDKLDIKLNENEVYYITKHIIASSLITTDKEVKVSSIYDSDKNNNILTETILKSIKDTFNVDFTLDNILKEFLSAHLKAAINRAKYGIKMENNMLGIIKNNYPFAFELGVLANNIIKKEQGVHLSEDDIGFLSLHFAASLERLKVHKIENVKKVIIVCTTGVGTSLLLKVKLEQYFKGRLSIVDTMPWYEFKEGQLEDIDFIITTVPLEIKSKKVVYIKNLLDKDEIKKIEDNLENIEYKENALINKFKEEIFFKDLEANTKEEVLEMITNNLIANGYITEAVKREIFSREELASTEIGNLVAIPHTMHDDIKKSVISVAILKKGITWDKENVQVVLLICMAKEDKYEWKSNLEQLYKSIIDIEIVLEIIKSNDFNDFKKVIYKF